MKVLQIASFSSQILVGLTTLAVVSVNTLYYASSSQAVTATTSFVCGKSNGKPATIARTKKGDVAIVIWSSEALSESGFTPQVRCQQVSARFQSLYRSGQLKYITAGTLNNLPVVCATKQVASTCNRQNLLYTLKPNTDPQQVIERLLAIRNRASSRGVQESASISTEAPTNSIDLDWLNEDN